MNHLENKLMELQTNIIIEALNTFIVDERNIQVFK